MTADHAGTDPRHDLETTEYWNAISERLRVAVLELAAAETVKAALLATIDLHIAWNETDQVFEAGRVLNVMRGVGCISCDHIPSPRLVPLTARPCSTVQSLQRMLLPTGDEGPPAPSTNYRARQGWDQGYRSGWDNCVDSAAGNGRLPKNPYA